MTVAERLDVFRRLAGALEWEIERDKDTGCMVFVRPTPGPLGPVHIEIPDPDAPLWLHLYLCGHMIEAVLAKVGGSGWWLLATDDGSMVRAEIEECRVDVADPSLAAALAALGALGVEATAG